MAQENETSVGSSSVSSSLEVDSTLHEGYVCTLTPELVLKAREELQEKPEWRLRDVQALRDMIWKDYPNLRTRVDDPFLLRFLRARKFDYDRALQLLVNYYGCRKGWPEVFTNLKPSAVKPVLDSGFLTVLPHTDTEGRRIVCIRPGMIKRLLFLYVESQNRTCLVSMGFVLMAISINLLVKRDRNGPV